MMNNLWCPRVGDYLVFTSDITHDDQGASFRRRLSWYVKNYQSLPAGNFHSYSHPIYLEVKKYDWYEINSLAAPRKSWKTWGGYITVGLKLELSKKDKKFLWTRVQALARAAAINIATENNLTLNFDSIVFGITTRTIDVTAKDINSKAIIVATREQAIALAAKLKGEAGKPEPTRWQRLET